MDNKYYYFGKALPNCTNVMPRGEWVPGWHYRIKVQREGSFLHLEDTHERYLPIQFDKLSDLQDVLTTIKKDLVSSLVGGNTEWPF